MSKAGLRFKHEASDAEIERLGLKEHSSGAWYTDRQAPGAWPNGARVKKAIQGEFNDTHAPGAMATILGSIGPKPITILVRGVAKHVRFGYFVEWDEHPGTPVFVQDWKLELVNGPRVER